jgi:Na+-transporting NADH:ubiquinone oxidoreductase subunit F
VDAAVHEITVNGVKRLGAEAGKTLLAALSEQGILVPSVCGGRGICGRCRVKVLAGGGPFTAREEAKLGQDERKAGIRLACQLRVAGDLSVEVPRELLKIGQYRARCTMIVDLARDIRQLRLELVSPQAIDYIPGQYIQINVPVYRDNVGVTRGYSIASDPREKHAIELVVRRAPHGISTTWIFEHLKHGDEITFSGPYGDFHLTPNGSPIILMAGGSGIAPIKCILHHMQNDGVKRKAVFFFGANRVSEMFYVDQMKRFESGLHDFKFVPVIARCEDVGTWQGERGLVTEAVARCIKDASEMEAYLCGSPGMIEASAKVLRTLGMPDKNIFYDKFA